MALAWDIGDDMGADQLHSRQAGRDGQAGSGPSRESWESRKRDRLARAMDKLISEHVAQMAIRGGTNGDRPSQHRASGDDQGHSGSSKGGAMNSAFWLLIWAAAVITAARYGGAFVTVMAGW